MDKEKEGELYKPEGEPYEADDSDLPGFLFEERDKEKETKSERNN